MEIAREIEGSFGLQSYCIILEFKNLPFSLYKHMVETFLLIFIMYNPSTEEYTEGDDGLFRISFCCLHIISLLSALANPILYGYYNKVSNIVVNV